MTGSLLLGVGRYLIPLLLGRGSLALSLPHKASFRLGFDPKIGANRDKSK